MIPINFYSKNYNFLCPPLTSTQLNPKSTFQCSAGNKNKPCSSCVDCIRNGFCQHWAHDGELFVKLMMSELHKHQKVSAEEMNQLPGEDINSYYERDDIGGNCMRNKIAYIAAYLFDLPAPNISKAEGNFLCVGMAFFWG